MLDIVFIKFKKTKSLKPENKNLDLLKNLGLFSLSHSLYYGADTVFKLFWAFDFRHHPGVREKFITEITLFR